MSSGNSDNVARYGLRTPGEPTQGAGAVAMLVSDRPAILSLDLGVSGVFSQDVYDFWRPLGRREAVVDGHYSIDCYLNALAGAYRGWRTEARARGLAPESGLTSEALARIVYHVPFCKMAKKAHLHLRKTELERDDDPSGNASFAAQVASSLELPSRIGNTYTASLYTGLMGLLDAEHAQLEGRRIGLFSYGSGCTSEFFSGVVGSGAARALGRAGIGRVLADRVRIDVTEYERIIELARDAPESAIPATGEYRLARIESDRRVYARGA